MTYLLNGKQFIAVSVGARDHAPEYVALTLPLEQPSRSRFRVTGSARL